MKTTSTFLKKSFVWAFAAMLIIGPIPAQAQKDTTKIEIGGMELIITEKIKRMEEGIKNLERGHATFEEQIKKAEARIAAAEKEIAALEAEKDEAEDAQKEDIQSKISKKEHEIAENQKRIDAFEEGMEELEEAMEELEEAMNEIGDDLDDLDDLGDLGDLGDLEDDEVQRIIAKKKRKFKGHWAGFEFGLSNFMNTDMTFPSNEELSFMKLNPEKSYGFAINFMEFNIPLISSYFGLTTGMGAKWNHFNLEQNVDLFINEDGVVESLYIDPALREYKRNNLNMAYLTIPLIAEIQFPLGKEKFYIGGGATGSMRMWSKHKQKYFIDGDKYKDKVTDDFQLSPFRYGLTFRIGYGPVGIFMNYELMPLFKENKGPELYPVTVGLRLINF